MSVWQEILVWWQTPPGMARLSLKGQLVVASLIIAILAAGTLLLKVLF